MLKRLRDFLSLSMGISTPGAEPNDLKWERLKREREEAMKKRSVQASQQQTPADRSSTSSSPDATR